MKACVIIPTFNSSETTKKLIQKLLNEQKNKNFDTIIVDMGSEDHKTLQIDFKDEKRVFIIHSEKDFGGAGSFWLGMKFAYEAGYEIFILTDNDCFPLSENLIDDILKNIETYGVLKPSDIERKEGDFAEPGSIAMHYLSVRREIVVRIGFPRIEFIIYCDDVDYSKRLCKAVRNIKIIKSYYRHFLKQTFDSSAFHKRLYYHVRNNILLVILDFIETRSLLNIGRILTMLWRFLLPSLVSERTFDYVKFVLKAFRDGIRIKIGKEHDLKTFRPVLFNYANGNSRRKRRIVHVSTPSAQKTFTPYLKQFLKSYFSLFRLFGRNIEISEISDYCCIVTAKEVKYKEYILRPKFLRNLVFSALLYPLLAFFVVAVHLPAIFKLNRSKYIRKLYKFFESELKGLRYEVIHCNMRRLCEIVEDDFKWLEKSILPEK